MCLRRSAGRGAWDASAALPSDGARSLAPAILSRSSRLETTAFVQELASSRPVSPSARGAGLPHEGALASDSRTPSEAIFSRA